MAPLLRIVDDPSVAHRGRVRAIHPISFRSKLHSGQACDDPGLYQGFCCKVLAEIKLA
jgi:hypothetical protein